MLQSFVITLREGLEAFLIVAISLAYLKKTGRAHLISAVHWGIGISIAASIGAGLLLQRASNQPLWEGDSRARRGRARRHAHRPHVAHGPAHEGGIEGRLETAALEPAAPRSSACSASRCS